MITADSKLMLQNMCLQSVSVRTRSTVLINLVSNCSSHALTHGKVTSKETLTLRHYILQGVVERATTYHRSRPASS